MVNIAKNEKKFFRGDKKKRVFEINENSLVILYVDTYDFDEKERKRIRKEEISFEVGKLTDEEIVIEMQKLYDEISVF